MNPPNGGVLSDRANPAAGRFSFVDNAKAIGIVLVVLGHSRGLPESWTRLVFGFHVPLFFFISGFLIKSERLALPVSVNAAKVWRTLGPPYILFFLLAWLYWLATRHIGGKAVLSAAHPWFGPLAGLFTGLEADLYVDPPLWFFPCLIVTAIAYHAARKWLNLGRSTALFVILAFFVVMAWQDVSWRLPLGLDNMWIALAFYALGQYLREQNLVEGLHKGALMLILLLAAALYLYTVTLNTRVDLANMLFGLHPALYLPAALFGIIGLFSLCRLLPRSAIADWLSNNTLAIFPAHFLFLSLVRGIATSLHLIPNDYNYGLGWSIFSSVLAIALCVPMVWCLRRVPVPIIRNAF